MTSIQAPEEKLLKNLCTQASAKQVHHYLSATLAGGEVPCVPMQQDNASGTSATQTPDPPSCTSPRAES